MERKSTNKKKAILREKLSPKGKKLTKPKQTELEHISNLQYFESMDRINRAIQIAPDIDSMMCSVLETTLSIFDCDRCWLLYPCDPDSPSFRVPMEITKPEYPGAKTLNIDIPLSPAEAQNMREALESDSPVSYTEGTERPISTAKQFGVRSQMFFPVTPKIGKPWIFGMHQCSYPRIWNLNEKRIFHEIARGLGHALTSLLAYKNLQDNEIKYRRIIEDLTDYQYSVRIENGQVVETIQSPACEIVTGYTSEEFYTDPYLWIRMVFTDDRELVRERVQQILEGIDIPPLEHRIVRKDGMIRWVCDTTILIKDTLGKLLSYHGVIKDITERKQSEEKFLKAFRSSPIALTLAGVEDGILMEANEAFEQITGYSLQESIGKTASELNLYPDPQERELFVEKLRNNKKLRNFEMHLRHRSGDLRIVQCSSEYIIFGKSEYVLSTTQDITEQKRIEKTLKEREEKFRNLFNNSEVGMFRTLLDGSEVLEFNEKYLKILGLTNEEVLGKPSKLLWVNPEERERMVKILEAEGYVTDFECSLFNKNGEVLNCITSLRLYREQNILEGSIQDISERKRAEEALRESEIIFNSFLENSPIYVFFKDSEIRSLRLSRNFEKMLNMPLEKSLGKTMYDLFPSDFAKNMLEDDKRILNEGILITVEEEFNGKYYETTKFPIFIDGKAKMLAGFTVDITERKKAEDERLRLQNLESLGVLAGGIAHDFNNILTSIMGRISIALDGAKEGSEKENLYAIEKASKRAVGLTNQLLTFARGGSPQKCFIDISKIIKDTTNFSLSGSNLIAEYNFASTLSLEADPNQVAQVIQNLVINAKQAMPSGGKIKISTENYYDLNESKFVKIIIEDQGIGISKDYLTKVFDPYFTTKQTGSGLGLSVCYSIIKRHKGRIYAYSEIGKGSIFTILLPAAENGNLVETRDKKFITQKYKILIMDDEEDIREMLSNLLSKSGHNFSLSSTGEEAIQIYKDEMEKGINFDLVFMDLTIKDGMGGKEAIKRLREIDPKAKVIVSSGYSDSLISNYEELGFDGALNKPYSKDQLNEIIFEVMNK